MKKMKLVMVGNGMAGVRTLEELIKLEPNLYDMTVFGAEPYPNYNRIMLSPVLAGEQGIQDIILNDLDWYQQHNITLHLNKKVVRIDRSKKNCLRRRWHAGRIRSPVAGHRLQPLHPACARQGSGRRDQLPRHSGHQCHDRRSGKI